jgi:hypothetical protein
MEEEKKGREEGFIGKGGEKGSVGKEMRVCPVLSLFCSLLSLSTYPTLLSLCLPSSSSSLVFMLLSLLLLSYLYLLLFPLPFTSFPYPSFIPFPSSFLSPLSPSLSLSLL